MRLLLASCALAAALLGAGSAQAEKRTFVITNSIKADLVGKCVSTPGGCARFVANAYCREHGYAQASNYRKLDSDEITGAVPKNQPNVGEQILAVDCTR